MRVYNRLNLEGLKELFNGCCILAKAYELESYNLVKDCDIIDNEHYFKLNPAVSSFSAGGTYKFNLECMSDTQKKWYQYYGKSWYCYKLNPNTNKYEEYKEGLGEYRALCDTNTNDRAFLFKEPGQYKITASVFQNSINPFDGVFGKLQEVETIEITVIDDADPAIVNLGLKEKYIRAIQYADLGTAFASLGMDIAGIALTIIAFVGIGFILKKVPAGKLKPFLTKVAKKFALPELLTFFGTVGDAFDVAAFIGAVCSFDEQVKNAKNEEHLKLAGKTWEKVVETFGLVAVMTFMNVVGRKMKKSDVEKEITSLDSIPDKTVDEDAIVKKYLEKLDEKSIRKLTRRDDGYEILKKYEAYFGDNIDFVNELIQNTPGKEIYVEPVQLLVKSAEKEKSFYQYCQSIKGKCKTNEQWVKCQIDCYNNLPKNSLLRINAQPVIDARYLLEDGSIDWPKFMGMKPETIKGISPENNLPTNLSRKGLTDLGKTFGDNPDLPNAKIATPYIDNPQAVHFANLSEEGRRRYFEFIDALNNNDKKTFISYFEDEIEGLDYYEKAKEQLNKFYDNVIGEMSKTDNGIKEFVDTNNYLLYFLDIKNNIETQKISYKYGLQGIIAPWKTNEKVLIGGGNQFSLPFTMDVLEDLSIINVKY